MIKKPHKLQAFIITSLIFALPLLGLVNFSSVFKIEMKGQDSISIAMGQFVAQGQFVAPKLAPEPILQKEKKKEKKKKRDKPKKPVEIAKNASKKLEEQTEEKPAAMGGAQVANNAPTQIGTLAYGKTDNPFLREIKAAIDKAARETYPHQAIKMHLTGKVWLEFVWRTNNTLEAVRIMQSSGYAILDDNVFKILARASKEFPPYKDNIRIQIPINYTLK